jgi:undecaprenyl-diphosphatase
VIALIQGVTELFPVSSLGHSVLVPAWFGGSWQTLVTQSSEQSSESSFYLAYIVALHCATALALMWFFRADWIRIIRGFFRSLPASVRLSLRQRRFRLDVADKDERLAWMIIFATIPVGLTGVVLEHTFRVLFAKPLAAAVLLFVNGLILLVAEAMRRSAVRRGQAAAQAPAGRPRHSRLKAVRGQPRPAPSGRPQSPGIPLPRPTPGQRRGPPSRCPPVPRDSRLPAASRRAGGRLPTSTPPSSPTPASPGSLTPTPY